MPLIYLNIFLQGVDPNHFNNFLLLGYAVMWIVGVFYVITLYNRQRNLRQDIRTLRQLLNEDEEK